MDSKERFHEITEANLEGHVGLCRELCEAFLRDYPDHGPVLLVLAMQLLTLRLYDDVERVLDRAEQVVPEHRRRLVWTQRGDLLGFRGHFTEAEAMYLRAYEAAPDDATNLIHAGSVASDQGEIERALDYYTRATQCREGCLEEAHFNRGGKLLTLKRYPEAVEAYQKALRIDPDYRLAKNKLRDLELLMSRAE